MTSNAPGPEAPRSLADLRALIIDIDGVLWRGDTALPGLAAFFAFMRERGILYAPDFLVNAGGLINVFEELQGYSEKRAMHHVSVIGRRTLDVLTVAKERGINPQDAAMQLATKRIEMISDLRRLSRGGLAWTEVNGT